MKKKLIFLFKVLELLACGYRKKCVKGSCLCIDNGLKCIDSCKIDRCGNMRNNDEDKLVTISYDSDGEYDDFDTVFPLISAEPQIALPSNKRRTFGYPH